MAAVSNTKTANNKQERINLRLSQKTKQKIERAASYEGEKISQFILASALDSAEKTIHEHEVTTLNAQDFAAFLDALAKPVRFNSALRKALREHDRRVRSK